jgi:hypothetical protein
MIQARREFIPYLAISVGLSVFERLFTYLFRVSGTLSMTLMFLPVLIAGFLWVVIRSMYKERLTRHKLYRLCSFMYHFSLTMLVNGLFIQGILESFSAESNYLSSFWILSGLSGLLFLVVLRLILSASSNKKRRK